MHLLSTGEPEVNLLDKLPALVKITVFSTGKKTHFFLTLSFPNICSLLQLNETQQNPGPRIHYMSAHLCIFLHRFLFWEQEHLLPHLPARPPLQLSPCAHWGKFWGVLPPSSLLSGKFSSFQSAVFPLLSFP